MKNKVKIPKLRAIPFESAIIERYKRRESSIEKALMLATGRGMSPRLNRE
ncbi:transposase [Leptospira wolffii]|uniref:Transposase n=1 Tax=Leptospira wolffii TaxID=409998 RepID=A0ABV5BRD3_9LEPT